MTGNSLEFCTYYLTCDGATRASKRLRNSNGFLSDFSWFDFIIRDFVVDYPSSCYYRCSCIWGVHVNFLLPNGKEFLYGLGMDTYQINRISAWLDPFSYAKTIAYQQTQGMVSIGSGGLTGKGFNVVDLSVPVRESDMIFTVIAEDFGFIGSAVVMGLYLLLIYRMIRVTFESNNRFYTYISTGFIMMILFHILKISEQQLVFCR